jgi:hypothetical protein
MSRVHPQIGLVHSTMCEKSEDVVTLYFADGRGRNRTWDLWTHARIRCNHLEIAYSHGACLCSILSFRSPILHFEALSTSN